MLPLKFLHFVWDYLPVILPLGVYFLSRFILLSASLWILLKTQDLQYNIPGMLGSAALASAFDMIPFVGHYAAVGSLLFCVLKMTHSHFVDVRFTVAISYAVMFLMQMLILSAAPVQLGVYARSPKVARALGMSDTTDETRVTAVPSKNPDDTDTDEASQKSAPTPTNTTVTASKPEVVPATKPDVASAAKPATAPATKPTADLSRNFSLKGVMKEAGLVIISNGKKSYTVGLGETVAMDTGSSKVDVSVASIADTSAVIKIDGVPTTLQVRQ